MPYQRIIQTNFTSGELSPRMRGRVDLDQYRAGAADLSNVLILTQGGATRRPGSHLVAPNKLAAGRVRLIPFVVASQVAYVFEFGAGYVRFFRNRGQLLGAGDVPLELATPYGLNDLRQLRVSQSVDVLYVCHVDHRSRKISRTSASTFTIGLVDWANGPYDRENTGDPGATGVPAATAPETGVGTPTTTGSGSGFIDSGGGGGGEPGGTGEGDGGEGDGGEGGNGGGGP